MLCGTFNFHPLFEIVKDLHSLEYEVYCRHGLNTSSESSRCCARSAHAYSADAYPAALQHSAAGYDVYMHACASVLLQHNIAAFLLSFLSHHFTSPSALFSARDPLSSSHVPGYIFSVSKWISLSFPFSLSTKKIQNPPPCSLFSPAPFRPTTKQTQRHTRSPLPSSPLQSWTSCSKLSITSS